MVFRGFKLTNTMATLVQLRVQEYVERMSLSWECWRGLDTGLQKELNAIILDRKIRSRWQSENAGVTPTKFT